MIDKVKFWVENAQISEDKIKLFNSFAQSKGDRSIRIYKRYFSLNDSSLLESEESGNHRIELTLVKNEKTKEARLYIYGSIRKWYFLKNNGRDLSYKQFLDCIDKLEKEIGLKKSSLWNAKVTKLETGITLRLKTKDKGLFYCLGDYKNFTKNIYGSTGVEFKGKNYDVAFYDKLREIYNKKDKLERNYRSLSKNNFLMRYEIQAHKLSGVIMFKKKLNRVYKIRDNWHYIGDNLIKTLAEVKFVDVLTSTMYVNLIGAYRTPMDRYLVYLGIESLGYDNLLKLLNVMGKKSEYKRHYLDLYKDFSDKDEQENYQEILTKKVQKRVSDLSQSAPL